MNQYLIYVVLNSRGEFWQKHQKAESKAGKYITHTSDFTDEIGKARIFSSYALAEKALNSVNLENVTITPCQVVFN